MRPALSRNVAASVVNAAAVAASSLVAVPLILDAVGTAGYGVWTLGLALILYASILETGLGPAVQRFTAYARGRDDAAELGRLAVSTLSPMQCSALSVGLVLFLAPRRSRPVRPPGAAPGRSRGDVPHPRRRARARAARRGAGNMLQGLERFGTSAAQRRRSARSPSSPGSPRSPGPGPPGRGRRRLHRPGGSRSLARRSARHRSAAPALTATARRVLGFSARLQVTVFVRALQLAERQVVVGLVAPPATVGQLGIGAQFADGGRVLAGAPSRRSSRRSRSPPAPVTKRAAPSLRAAPSRCGCSASSAPA